MLVSHADIAHSSGSLYDHFPISHPHDDVVVQWLILDDVVLVTMSHDQHYGHLHYSSLCCYSFWKCAASPIVVHHLIFSYDVVVDVDLTWCDHWFHQIVVVLNHNHLQVQWLRLPRMVYPVVQVSAFQPCDDLPDQLVSAIDVFVIQCNTLHVCVFLLYRVMTTLCD